MASFLIHGFYFVLYNFARLEKLYQAQIKNPAAVSRLLNNFQEFDFLSGLVCCNENTYYICPMLIFNYFSESDGLISVAVIARAVSYRVIRVEKW